MIRIISAQVCACVRTRTHIYTNTPPHTHIQTPSPHTHTLLTNLSFSIHSIWPNYRRTLSSIHNLRHSIHTSNTKQTTEALHLHDPNPRPFLFFPYHCLTATQQSRHYLYHIDPQNNPSKSFVSSFPSASLPLSSFILLEHTTIPLFTLPPS